MTLETAGLWAKVGFIVGCAAGLSLAVAEFAAWGTSGGPALARPFEGLAILTVVLLVLGSAIAVIGVWLARRQDQIIRKQDQLEALVGQQYATAYAAGVSARPDEPVVRMHSRNR